MHNVCPPATCLSLILLVSAGNLARGQEAAAETDDTAAIQAAVQSYVTAYLARDAEQLAAHWSPDGVYTSRTDGSQFVGREAILEEFKRTLAGENVPKLAVTTESIDFISPNVALERGTATVTQGDEDPFRSTYTAVYVKHDGQWLLDRVTEDEIVVTYSNRDRLAELDWLIGEWVDIVDGLTIELDCRWTRNQNFISRTYKVFGDGDVQSSGLQIIGWDPAAQQIRSWLFDSDGGYVSGIWSKRDTKWVVQSTATLPDGATGSFTSVFRPLEDGSYGWQKINRVLDGQLLPNIEETIVQRK